MIVNNTIQVYCQVIAQMVVCCLQWSVSVAVPLAAATLEWGFLSLTMIWPTPPLAPSPPGFPSQKSLSGRDKSQMVRKCSTQSYVSGSVKFLAHPTWLRCHWSSKYQISNFNYNIILNTVYCTSDADMPLMPLGIMSSQSICDVNFSSAHHNGSEAWC